MAKTFRQFLAEARERAARIELLSLLEHSTYKRLPGTASSYRSDAPNTNTKTQRHSHVYAKPNGKGKQLYAVNVDGTGHDGSSGTQIPQAHADHFRSIGYEIPLDNILESLDMDSLTDAFELIFVED